MGEKNIAPMFFDFCMAIERDLHIRKRETGQLRERIFLYENRGQRWTDLRYAVAKDAGKPVAVSARSGGWIGASPCGYHQQLGVIAATNTAHKKTILPSGYGLDSLTALDDYPQFLALQSQDIQHIPRLHSVREYLTFPFLDHAQPQDFEEGNEIAVRKSEKSRAQEPAMISIVVKKVLNISIVSYIAAATA